MQSVKIYIERNKLKINDIFKTSSKENEIPATKLFLFLQDIFKIQQIKIMRKGKEYFKGDDNQPHTQKIIEQYYKTTPNGKKAKFYLYRIGFSFTAIEDYLQYWLATDKLISVDYPNQKKPIQTIAQPPKQVPPISLPKPVNVVNVVPTQQLKPIKEQVPPIDNQFLLSEQKNLPSQEAYQKEIQILKEMLANVTINAKQSIQISKKIELYKQKVQQMKPKEVEVKMQKKNNQNQLNQLTKIKTQASRAKKQVNFKLLFEFYARQNHLTGALSSFQQIQHQSQTINYQKLVYFLKQYEIFPQKSKDQKRLHTLYVRMCSSTRDLHYSQFMQLLQKLPEILFDGPQSLEAKKELLINKIESKQDKNKLLYNPFHSLEKSNFRIDSQHLKYSFKLKPLKGKLQEQVNHELQSRRKQKQLEKQQSTKQKRQMFLLKLKKLMSIDPYHPQVIKNADLLHKRSSSVIIEPIASLQNMEKFRDIHFDMKAQFGISDFQQDPLKQISRRYDVNRRAEVVEKEEEERMSLIMNGLISRSEAKIQKFSSPKKRHISSKLN